MDGRRQTGGSQLMSEALPQDIGSIFVLNGPEILVQPNGLSDPSHPPFHFVIPPAMLPPVCGLLR